MVVAMLADYGQADLGTWYLTMFPFTSCKQFLFDVKEIVQENGEKTSLNTRDVIIFHDDTRRAKEHD